MKDRFEEIKKMLKLGSLEKESGLFAVENVSSLEVTAADGPSPASNCIYYALTREYPQNHLHWLFPDDHHILIEGGPADYFVFHPDGSVKKQTLGRLLSADQKLMLAIPGGCGKAIRLHPDSEYLLVGSVVTPAWNKNRISFGAGQAFIDTYSGKAEWATPEFLGELIGPNWIADTPL